MDTIEETRLKRLIILRNELGSAALLAETVGISESQVSQWFTMAPDSKTGKKRNISNSSARKIEQKTGKQRGWMDQPVYADNEVLTNLINILISMDTPQISKIEDVIRVLFPEEKKINE